MTENCGPEQGTTTALTEKDQKPNGTDEENGQTSCGRDQVATYGQLTPPYNLIARFEELYDMLTYEPDLFETLYGRGRVGYDMLTYEPASSRHYTVEVVGYDKSLVSIARRISMESSHSRTSRASRASRATVDSGYYSATSLSRLRAGGNGSVVHTSSSTEKGNKKLGDELDAQAQNCHGKALKKCERIEKMCEEAGHQVGQQRETVPALQSKCYAKRDPMIENEGREMEIEGERAKGSILEEATTVLSPHEDTKITEHTADMVDIDGENDQAYTVRDKDVCISGTESSTRESQNQASPLLSLRSLPLPLDRNVMTLSWLEGESLAVEPRQNLLPESSLSPSRSSNSRAESDGGSFWWSDDLQEDLARLLDDHVLQPFRSTLALHLFSKFQICASGSDEEGSAAAQGSKLLQTKDGSSGSSQEVRRGKRKKSNGSSNDNEDHRFHRRKFSCPSEDADEKLLACPFCKHNPRRYRDCYKYVLRDVSRLKQHLSRRHRIPLHCPSCSHEFESEIDRDQHIRSRSCVVLPPRQWDGIDETQKRQLERRVSTKKTKEENWYIIYDILFPEAARPRSPYVDAPLSEELLALQEFTSTEGPSVVSEFTRNELPETLRPHEQEIQVFLETTFQDAVGLLLERYATSLPAQPQNSNESRLSMVQSNSSESGYASNGAVVGNEISHNADASVALTAQTSIENPSDLAMNVVFDPPWNPLFATASNEMEYNTELFLSNYEGLADLFGQRG